MKIKCQPIKRPTTTQFVGNKVKFALATATLGMTQLPAYGQSVLEEVIVTANRRAESMQTVPLAVTAFSGEMLQQQGIVDIKGISERTPGFTMGMLNPGQPQMYIRGIGSNEDGAGGDQSVIAFIDEVYIGRSAGMDLDLFDLERVEVLRGPQGTLFGKNVIGGAINLITRKPSEDQEFAFEATYGSLDTMTLRGLASGPLAENIYGKISFSSQRRDGYMESQIKNYPQYFPGETPMRLNSEDAIDANSDSLRGTLRFVPSDKLEINITASTATTDISSQPNHWVGPAGNPYLSESILIPNYENEIHKALFDDSGFFKSDTWSLTGRADYDINDRLQLTSISAFRKVESENSQVIGGTPYSSAGKTTGINALRASVLNPGARLVYGTNDYIDDSDTFTQELRLTSTGESDINWVGGLYFMNENTHRNETASFGMDMSLPDGSIIAVFPKAVGGDDQHNETNSYAAFGQLTWDISERLSLTLGGRYTREKKEIDRVGTANILVVVEDYIVSASESWSEFTKKASINYQLNDDLFVYATYSEGFKSGGFQGLAATRLAASTAFAPETAKLYEVGAKSEWLENRLRLNLALFKTDYKDLQILQGLVPESAPEGASAVIITQNASDAQISGAELELSASPIDGLTISGAYSYLDTEYRNFNVPAGFRAPPGADTINRDGNELRNAPTNSYNLLVRYEWFLANGGSLAAQGEWRHKDKSWQEPDNISAYAVPAYDVADARLTYTLPQGNVEFTGWVKNLTDEGYLLHNYPLLGSGGSTPAPPRTYGLTVSWRNF
jgi:iron complex outermembrane receptor protein